MRRTAPALALIAAASALAGCRVEKPAPPPPPPPRVTVVKPVLTPVRDYWVYNGYLEGLDSVEVRSKIRGFLTEVRFKEGTEVDEDAVLFKIDEREYDTAVRRAKAELAKAEAQIKSWEAQIDQSKADLERVKQAVAGGAESRFKEDEAKATLAVREAEYKASVAARDAAKEALQSANLQFSYTEVKARIGGRIGRRLVDKGTLVQADTTLMATIVRVDKLYVYFDTPEADFFSGQKARLKAGTAASAEIKLEVSVGDERDFPHPGTFDFQDNRVESATGTIRLRGQLDNPLINGKARLLYPGMYARVRLPKSEPTDQPAIPEDCLVTGQEGRFVYVVKSDNTVEKRLVTVGPSVWKAPPAEPGKAVSGWAALNPSPTAPPEGQPPAPTRKPIKSVIAIPAGLEPGDRIILDGLQQARPGATVAPEEWNLTAPPVEDKK